MATPEEYKWLIEMVQGRYQAYNLTFEQAEAVYSLEQERDTPSEKHFFSQWEQWDFELMHFRQILKDEQLALYLQDHEAEVKAYEKHLVEEDNSERQLKQLDYVNRTIRYYKDEFMPALAKNEPVRRLLAYMQMKGSKFTYLKEEYAKYLSDAKKEMMVSAFRHNRTFRPNELKQAMLWHSINYLWPDYQAFSDNMDKPTRAVADYFQQEATFYLNGMGGFPEQVMKEKQNFATALFHEFYGENHGGGWHVVIKTSPEEELSSAYMSLLLLDTSVLNTHNPFVFVG